MNPISFTDFSREVYPFLDMQAFHGRYYRLLELFARGHLRRLIVTMPPQHGKSVGASTLLPAYMLGLNPDMRIAIASYSSMLASKFNRRVQRIIESKEYAEIFPDTTIKKGTKADKVKTLQKFLNWYGGYGLAVDGICGKGTVNAIKKFQKAEGIKADGIYGTNSQAKAKASCLHTPTTLLSQRMSAAASR